MKYGELKITKDTLEYEILGTIQKNQNTLTVKNFRNQVEKLEYQKIYDSIGGKKATNEKLEAYRLPAFVYSYYKLLIMFGKIPTIEELCNNYIDTYAQKVSTKYQLKRDYIVDGKNILFTIEELKGRICRAYNSYHREVDLLLQLFENYGNEFNFYYSFEEDYFNGVDIVAFDKSGRRFDIATYFSSKRSLSYKKRKNTSRHEYTNISIDVLANFEGPDKNVTKVGDAKLYNTKAVEFIYSEMTKKRAA